MWKHAIVPLICAVGCALSVFWQEAHADGAPETQNAKLTQALQAIAVPRPQFIRSCLASIDQAQKNGFQDFAGIPLTQLRSAISRVQFYSVPEPYHFDYEMNEGHSALCVKGTGNTPPSVYLDSNATQFLSSTAQLNPALQSNLCLHEALCALGDGDQNYSASLMLNDMAFDRASPLLQSPVISSQIEKSLLQNGQKIQGIISHYLGAEGTGTSIGGGGDLSSLILKETLLDVWFMRDLYARAMTEIGRPLPIDYESLLPLILDCDFDLVDIHSIFKSRPYLPLAGHKIIEGIYPVKYVSPLNRIFFYIDESYYNGLTANVPKEKILAAQQPFYDALFNELNGLREEGYTTCNSPAAP